MLCSHYTTTEGLLGILKEGKIRATNIQFLNDKNEYLDALNLIREIIEISDEPKPGVPRDKFEGFKGLVLSYLNDAESDWRLLNYSVSFSREFDLLSQWRAYANGINGYGVIFDTGGILKQADAKHDSLIYFGDCIYDVENKRGKVRALLNSLFVFYKKEGEASFRAKCLTDIDELACMFKDPSFKEEAEKRLVISVYHDDYDGICFKAGKSSLVPYKEIEFSRDLVKEIKIGPCIDQKASAMAVRILLRSLGLNDDDVKISESRIPFRNW